MTTELDDVDSSEIERLSRAIQAQLHPLTGARAFGTATVARTIGTPVELPPNTYAIPVDVSGQHPVDCPLELVKVDFNPATEQAHKQGGEWIVGATPLQVSFIANAGGVRFNRFGVGWKLRFDPPVPGLEPEAVVDAQWSGGTEGLLKSVAIYEDGDESSSIFGAGTTNFPACIISWLGEETVEGRTAGVSQGATRKNRNTRSYYEDFAIYVITSRSESGHVRRREGLRLMEGVRNCLSDHAVNDDGEQLTTVGTGVEVMSSARSPRSSANVWAYFCRIRCSTSVTRVDTREWTPYNRTKFELSLPEKPPGEPGDTGELILVAPNPAEERVGIIVEHDD